MFDEFEDQHLAVAWSGLPPYAAYCLAELARQYLGRLTILGTKADVPHQGLEAMIGQEIHWLERNKSYGWKELDLEVPDRFIHTGWAYPAFNSLGAEVGTAGGQRYSMIDTIWYGTWRQYVGLAYFRLVYRKWFDAVLVPGVCGRRFCRRIGMPNELIFEGLYGANPKIFTQGPTLSGRPKRILFVGRLIERKGIPALLQAARESARRDDGWEFVLVGSGPMEAEVRAEPSIHWEPFASPDTIAEWMRASQFLVLPSLEENWGVVAHEAALSGCGLILAEGIGAAEDLLSRENGILVRKGEAESLSQAFETLAGWSSAQYQNCEQESSVLAANFGPLAFVQSVERMLSAEG